MGKTMSPKTVLFCKSYGPDMLRACRLTRSIKRHNRDNLEFHLSAPEKDIREYQSHFAGLPVIFHTDEEIFAESEKVWGKLPTNFPKHLIQQLIKLEFSRLNLCDIYVWLDSDCYFIRPFQTSDFVHEDGNPYTVCHDGSVFLDYAKKYNKPKVAEHFYAHTARFKAWFNREGKNIEFGWPPLNWSMKVLKHMEHEYLKPNKMTIYDLVVQRPGVMQLYGEYMMHCKQIPFHPKDPMFRCYHYPEMFAEDEDLGEDDYSLAEKGWMGIIRQSNWTNFANKPKKSIKERIRARLDRIKFQLQNLSS